MIRILYFLPFRKKGKNCYPSSRERPSLIRQDQQDEQDSCLFCLSKRKAETRNPLNPVNPVW